MACDSEQMCECRECVASRAKLYGGRSSLGAALKAIIESGYFEPQREQFVAGERGQRAYAEACDIFEAARAAIAKADGH